MRTKLFTLTLALAALVVAGTGGALAADGASVGPTDVSTPDDPDACDGVPAENCLTANESVSFDVAEDSVAADGGEVFTIETDGGPYDLLLAGETGQEMRLSVGEVFAGITLTDG
ncbi:hypothetical protein ACKVMT_11235 [Halobacteriales archaeon Cl-PHB]